MSRCLAPVAREFHPFNPPIPLQSVKHPLYVDKKINVKVIRLDLLHPTIGGNKWFKLKRNLIQAIADGNKTLVSFGGAYSNHIHALAAAGHGLGMATVAFVRGEAAALSNPTLTDARRWGMEIHFLSREDYRKRHDEAFLKWLQSKYATVANGYWIAEGGSNALGVQGCQDILSGVEGRLARQPDYLACAVGTGATFAGLVSSPWATKFLGINVVNAWSHLNGEIHRMLSQSAAAEFHNWELLDSYHCGGYAKIDWQLANFIRNYKVETGIPLDPIYNGKLFYAIHQLLEHDYFAPGEEVVLLHSGGLQGSRGMQQRLERLLE